MWSKILSVSGMGLEFLSVIILIWYSLFRTKEKDWSKEVKYPTLGRKIAKSKTEAWVSVFALVVGVAFQIVAVFLD